MKTAPTAAIGINLVFFLYHIPASIEANEIKRIIIPVVLSKNFIILSTKLSELSYIVFMLLRSTFEIVAAAIPIVLNPMRVVHKIMPIIPKEQTHLHLVIPIFLHLNYLFYKFFNLSK